MSDELAAHIQAVVAAAPPLTDEQLNTIVSILAPTPVTAPGRTRIKAAMGGPKLNHYAAEAAA
ncbi:hypothetical protein [Kribbella italica]|uniref:Uncharacterized protein n=1 Tax=Kribbella italica TaxID=1540520 RepID=A0A7W9J899_9ACTN|nr:hypothetical protein [Kribbella italica]MBB5837461.1 hypothetical protein [Kribbella italica]